MTKMLSVQPSAGPSCRVFADAVAVADGAGLLVVTHRRVIKLLAPSIRLAAASMGV